VKKLLIPIAAVSIGAAAYLYQQHEKTYDVLDYIPADTALFVGDLQPQPLENYLAITGRFIRNSDIKNIESLVTKENNTSPARQFILALFNDYQSGIADPKKAMTTFGLGESIKSYLYTLGLIPVIKIQVDNPQVIWDLLDKHEAESGFTHQSGHLQGADFRAYRLTPDHAEVPLDLVVAQRDGFLTFTINSTLISEAQLAIALGLDKPQHTLAESNRVENIAKKYDFIQQNVGFINHVAIVDGIVGKKDSLLAQQIATLSEKNNNEYFQALHNPSCQNEFSSIANNWPSTAFGYTQLDLSAGQLTDKSSLIIESKNKTILSALQTLRGFIPAYAQQFENSLVSMSLGLDVSHLSTALTTIWSDLQTPVYQCAPLAVAQASIKESGKSIGVLGLATNMAASVKGISAGLFDYKLKEDDTGNPTIDSLEGIVSLHLDNPEAFLNSIKLFSPELQKLSLTQGGNAVSLNHIAAIDPVLNLDLKAVIRGDHLIIYHGEKGKQEAEKLGNETLSKNGFYQVSFDIKGALTPLVDSLKTAGEPVPDELVDLLDYDLKTQIHLDINDHGIRIDTTIKTPPMK